VSNLTDAIAVLSQKLVDLERRTGELGESKKSIAATHTILTKEQADMLADPGRFQAADFRRVQVALTESEKEAQFLQTLLQTMYNETEATRKNLGVAEKAKAKEDAKREWDRINPEIDKICMEYLNRAADFRREMGKLFARHNEVRPILGPSKKIARLRANQIEAEKMDSILLEIIGIGKGT